MAAEYKILTGDQIKPGEQIPAVAFDVSATTVVLGALATRDFRPMHHDKDFAIHQGVKDIFLNTPNQAAWFERALTDWTGPLGRLGRMKFKMKKSVCPGDKMEIGGTVTKVEKDEKGCCWVDLDMTLKANGEMATECAVRVAVPASKGDNPWKRRGDDWKP